MKYKLVSKRTARLLASCVSAKARFGQGAVLPDVRCRRRNARVPVLVKKGDLFIRRALFDGEVEGIQRRCSAGPKRLRRFFLPAVTFTVLATACAGVVSACPCLCPWRLLPPRPRRQLLQRRLLLGL